MLTKLIAIGNSKVVCIPQTLIEESGLPDEVELTAQSGEIRITKVTRCQFTITQLSEQVLAKDWTRTEEDTAWSNL
jgi:antitoxin component of MazEF toxin-antitoxin module